MSEDYNLMPDHHTDTNETEPFVREKKLFQSQQMLQAILDDIPQRVFCKDLNLKYLWCNKAFVESAGFSGSEEIVGKNDFELPWKHRAELYRSDDLAVIKSGIPKLHYIEPGKTGGDEIRWSETSKIPIRDETGHIFGVVGSFEDITERKLASENLLKAKEKAEAANRSKDEFLATVSHELLTPLNGIMGFAYLIEDVMDERDTPYIKDVKKHLRTIRECGESLLGIINDILELSRTAVDKYESFQEAFSPQKFIESTLDMFRFKADKNHDSLTFSAGNLPEIIICDQHRLRQILFNLIGNAVKFTENGQVEVWAEVVDRRLRISIKDTGVGIPRDKQAIVMEPFVQADQTSTRKFSGVGLGLTIVSRMLVQLNGTIEFESEENKGSVFSISIPVGDAQTT